MIPRVPSNVCPFPLPVKAHYYVNQENDGLGEGRKMIISCYI